MSAENQIGTLNQDEVAQGEAVTQPGPAAPVVVGVQRLRRQYTREELLAMPKPAPRPPITPTWVPGVPKK